MRHIVIDVPPLLEPVFLGGLPTRDSPKPQKVVIPFAQVALELHNRIFDHYANTGWHPHAVCLGWKTWYQFQWEQNDFEKPKTWITEINGRPLLANTNEEFGIWLLSDHPYPRVFGDSIVIR